MTVHIRYGRILCGCCCYCTFLPHPNMKVRQLTSTFAQTDHINLPYDIIIDYTSTLLALEYSPLCAQIPSQSIVLALYYYALSNLPSPTMLVTRKKCPKIGGGTIDTILKKKRRNNYPENISVFSLRGASGTSLFCERVRHVQYDTCRNW